MDERLDAIEAEFAAVEAQLMEPATSADPNLLRELSKRHKELSEIVAAYRQLRSAREDVEVATELYEGAEPSDREEMRAELERSTQSVADIEAELQGLLLPKDPNDGRAVIVEIRGAEGGEEANLFARDLYEMYLRYAATRGFKVEVIEEHASERDGLDEVVFKIVGADAWTRFEHEGGVHRVQRVPVTESKGRVHTSSATVMVLPEAEEVDVDIDPNDLKIDVYRSSGPGGQSVNTTDSAVRITHLPTGIVVAMQDEKSQIQNRAKAMLVLRSRLLKAAQDAHAAEVGDLRRSQVGGGGRSEKIRTYNFKESRVTDHRINLTLYKLDAVLGGDLDEIVDALMAAKRARQLTDEAGG